MDGLKRLLSDEPVMVQGLVQAGVAMLVGFGLEWSADQVALVLAFTATLLAVLARAFVTPTSRFDAAVNEEAENILTERAEPLTAEERATLDQLRSERDTLLAANRRKKGTA